MSENHSRPGLGIRHGDDHAVDEPDGDVVYSFMVRQRLREEAEEVHRMAVARCIAASDCPPDWRRLKKSSEETYALVVDRLRYATRQGDAASPARLVAELRELGRASKRARAAPSDAATQRARVCYMEVAATCLILGERATRPRELKRGAKSSTARYRPPGFWIPSAAEVSSLLAYCRGGARGLAGQEGTPA